MAFEGEVGHVTGVRVVMMEADESERWRRKVFRPLEGIEEVIPADRVIIAFGYRPSPDAWMGEHRIELHEDGRIVTGGAGRLVQQTTNDRIFAGGDAVRGADLVVTAVFEGRGAARSIVSYLKDKTPVEAPETTAEAARSQDRPPQRTPFAVRCRMRHARKAVIPTAEQAVVRSCRFRFGR